ncbi:hypothetical protein BDV27DRAFT_140109 [Aspergillus caelatus]|uniref:Uncharacterized protein n=1 Tax=Aspergillus caelatus TaxID=61420 RepID=A0A5N7ALY1_9EURO|nr:uncharacterized protein BDV27DRAFT_140109 [Aspergillus caelatus]KAE8370877.1 hypothetical protein BDV27DRAFT_140109 [Aspergillus caelatus]
MVTRGLWNLHVDGKWYRSLHPPRGRITSPDAPATFISNWEPVPFPTPLHIELDYVYNIDKDLRILTIIQWSGADDVLLRLVRKAKLCEIENCSLTTVEAVLQNMENFLEGHSAQDDKAQSSAALDVDISTLTPLNELQFRSFTDFAFLWKFYFDDVVSWVREPLLNTLAIGILRIAAWDFEILLDTDTGETPIKFYSAPGWPAPSQDIFWFHGFLVTLYNATDAVDHAILKAKAFLDKSQRAGHHASVILIPLSHVTLVEISGTCVQRSPAIPLIVNSFAMHPSPGFRVLASILSSDSWKLPRAHTETWEINLPLELNGLHLRNRGFSIPCCGEQPQSNRYGVHRSLCYAWFRKKCIVQASDTLENIYRCSKCRQNKTYTILESGGIYGEYRKKKSRPRCKVAINGMAKTLHLRLGKPALRRPELWLIRGMSVPPKTINYTIYFNDVFSGLAHGLDE